MKLYGLAPDKHLKWKFRKHEWRELIQGRQFYCRVYLQIICFARTRTHYALICFVHYQPVSTGYSFHSFNRMLNERSNFPDISKHSLVYVTFYETDRGGQGWGKGKPSNRRRWLVYYAFAPGILHPSLFSIFVINRQSGNWYTHCLSFHVVNNVIRTHKNILGGLVLSLSFSLFVRRTKTNARVFVQKLSQPTGCNFCKRLRKAVLNDADAIGFPFRFLASPWWKKEAKRGQRTELWVKSHNDESSLVPIDFNTKQKNYCSIYL